MRVFLLLLVLIGLVLTAAAVRFTQRQIAAARLHEPVEYYAGWGGYRHPVALENRITMEEAEALNARGAVVLAANYDGARLMRVTKFWRGEMFFEYAYAYHGNGRLKSATVSRGGQTTVLEYDVRGRRISQAMIAF